MEIQGPTVWKYSRFKQIAFNLAALWIILSASAAWADVSSVEQGLAQYRAMLEDGNPAELAELKGQSLFEKKQGSNHVSLQQCDFGLGPGVLKGAFAQLPRYFKDAGRMMGLESRLVYCMQTLQGRDTTYIEKHPFSAKGQSESELEALAAYVAAQSRGMPIHVPQNLPQEKASRARGEQIFFYRAGPYDFACASCHGVQGQRIRLQELPELSKPADARKAFGSWPAYRLSQGVVRTMQWRLYDCFRQQRLPALKFGSEASVDLMTYLGVKADGGFAQAPGLKR